MYIGKEFGGMVRCVMASPELMESLLITGNWSSPAVSRKSTLRAESPIWKSWE